MLSIDPGDGLGSFLPGDPPPVPAAGAPGGRTCDAGKAGSPAQPPRDIVPPQAMANGGTIIRPGAVAWGGTGDRGNGADGGGRLPAGRYSSCEAIERELGAVLANPARLPALFTELAASRLWVPLPDRRGPLTDGAAVRLPVVGYENIEFVPCFTSVQRLTAWADLPGTDLAGPGLAGPGARRSGDNRTVPHIVVPAAGLAARLPAGVGLALNPDAVPGLPLYPECVPYLARLAPAPGGARGPAYDDPAMEHLLPGTGLRVLIGQPPAEPATLLAETRIALRSLPAVFDASRAWVSVPGQGAGLVIAVGLDDPASDRGRTAAVNTIERVAAKVPLRVPFALDVIFPGEPAPGAGNHSERPGLSVTRDAEAMIADSIDAWIAVNTRPFYVRG
jgi:hypothetical protein